jgi:hypothetical protein
MNRLVALLVAAFAAMACGTPQPATTAPRLEVYALAGDHIDAYDLQGNLERSLPVGIPSPDWSLLYVSLPSAVEAIDTKTGGVVRTLALDGAYPMPRPNVAGLPQGLSAGGGWLALGGKGRFIVVDSAFKTKPKLVSLTGDFEFDALSDDGRRLYLAEVLPHGYQIRLYDLAAGLEAQPIVDKLDVEASMSGFRVTSVEEPGGRFHYGLYVRPDQPPFVHALPTEGQLFAYCVFLPWPGYNAPTPDWSLARTADGRFLYATSGVLQRVVEISSEEPPKVTRTLAVPRGVGWRNPFVTDALAKADAPAPGAVLSRDQRQLFFPDIDGIDVVDLKAFQVTKRYASGQFVQSLVAAPDGSLFALTIEGTLLRIDAASGRQVARVQLPGGVQRLLFVAAAPDHG